jgi:hypothetical protein
MQTFQRLAAIIGVVAMLAARDPTAASEPLVYPAAVSSLRFATDRSIYKPGEPVRLACEFTASNLSADGPGTQIEIQIWLERELSKPQLCAAKKIRAKRGINREELVWTAGEGVFGHLATMRLVDGFGRNLAERTTLFDVAQNWVDVMRLACCGANHVAVEGMADLRMLAILDKMRSASCNALEVYTFSPKPYELAPREDRWPYQYRAQQIVLKERLQAWSAVLHRSGMKYVAYNETSAAEGPPDWQVYLKEIGMDKPCAYYFADRDMFTPNSLRIAPRFARQLADSVRMFGWDGILMDSALACHIATSKGLDRDGRKLTDLPPGEVGCEYLKEARRKAREINPDFALISQNATSISHVGVKLAADKMFPWIRENCRKLRFDRDSPFHRYCDAYTLEIDSHNEPRDGRYPLTYEKMSVALNSIVEATGRPLMSWALVVTPFCDEYSIAFTRPYMSLIYASRTKLNDHFAFDGGALSDGAEAPASRLFIRYNRFAARFSWYLWNPKFKWVLDPARLVAIRASRPLFWERTVYQADDGHGGTVTVVHLLNLPSNGLILGQKEIPEPLSGASLRLSTAMKAARISYLSADDESLEPLDLVPSGETEAVVTYPLPPVRAWSVLVIRSP